MQAAAIQACPQILDNDLNLRVKDNVVAMLILCGVSTDQRLVAKYVYFFLMIYTIVHWQLKWYHSIISVTVYFFTFKWEGMAQIQTDFYFNSYREMTL